MVKSFWRSLRGGGWVARGLAPGYCEDDEALYLPAAFIGTVVLCTHCTQCTHCRHFMVPVMRRVRVDLARHGAPRLPRLALNFLLRAKRTILPTYVSYY